MQNESSSHTRTPITREDIEVDNFGARCIETEVSDSFEKLAPIQQEWDSFIESVGGEIFLTYDWCRIWWKYYGGKRKLRIFTFRHQGTLVGIIPVFLEKIWLGPTFVRAVKIVGTDFTPIAVSLPVRDDLLSEVLHAFLSESISKHQWDILYIGPLAGLFDKYEKIVSMCREILGQSHHISIKENNVQTYFKLGENWESYLAGLSKDDRGDVRRNYRYISKTVGDESAQVISRFADAGSLEEIFNEFVDMHQEHWKKIGKAGHFGDWPDARNFHFEVAKTQLQKNRLRLLKVMIKDYCLGYEYNYKFGETFFQFLNARSDIEQLKSISVGKIVFGELVKSALDEKVRYIDSMRGKYEYKLRLGGELLPIHSIYISRSNLSTILRLHICRGISWVLNTCYHKIWFRRVVPKLPFRRGHLWKIWIKSQIFLS
jgi:CelD/BcsL family acetyltransferase involved in cellulose biosynthesis